jgi:hypothetical protein
VATHLKGLADIRRSLSSRAATHRNSQAAIHLSSRAAIHLSSRAATHRSNRAIRRKEGIPRNRLPGDIRLSNQEALGLRGPGASLLVVPLHRARRAR